MKGGKNIFSSSEHLSTEQILNYLRNSLTRKEMHEVEKHLADCELCSDAIDGSKKLEADASLMKITSELQKMARKRKMVRRRIFSQIELISLFAVVFLILFLIVVVVVIFWKK